MSLVLVDSSAWIDFFRGDAAAIARIDPLLAAGEVAICGPIHAELLSGARTRAEFHSLRSKLRALAWIADGEEVWERVAEARYALARGGHQAATIDLMIALAASAGGCELLTRDQGFRHIRRAVAFELRLF